MKTTIEVMRDILEACEGTETQDDVKANKFIRTNMGEIQKCMKKYAKQFIEEIEDCPNTYIRAVDGSNVYVDRKEMERLKKQL